MTIAWYARRAKLAVTTNIAVEERTKGRNYVKKVLILAAVAALAVLGASPALGAETLSAKVGHHPTVHVRGLRRAHVSIPAPEMPRRVQPGRIKPSDTAPYPTTSFWSGYGVLPAKGLTMTAASADFNIPSINCASSSAANSYVFVYAALDEFGLGTGESVGSVARCAGTTPQYYLFYALLPQGSVSYSGVGPGDAIQASVEYSAGTGDYVMTVNDVTIDSGVTVDLPCAASAGCANASAEVAITPAAGLSPLSDFGQVSFTNASVTSSNGKTGTLDTGKDWTSYASSSVNGTDLLAEPGSLEGGKAFYDTWLAFS
jgi:hypothetical protein